MKRKPISKKVRFEVFKRDAFTCQYCGRSAPDVILEVDHIDPVADGGSNEIMNLITSCRDCNRGKGKRRLSDDSALSKQKAQLDELNERREQMEMMIEWKRELTNLGETQVQAIDELIQRLTLGKHSLSPIGKNEVNKLIKEFGFTEVYESTEIAYETYYRYYNDESRDRNNATYAFKKIGGVCHNRKNGITREMALQKKREREEFEEWKERYGKHYGY